MDRRMFATVAAVGALSLCSSVASAQSFPVLGHGGTGDPFMTFHDATPGTNTFVIDGGPFTFDYDGGVPWLKTLNAPSNGWQPGQIYTIHERFTFLPDPTGLPSRPITDWHERIDLGLDGKIWDIWTGDPMVSVNGDPASGLMTMFSDDRTEVWFFFDPVTVGPNGATFEIWKEFQFVGMTPMTMPVRIFEYPTPAPGALALAGMAGIAAARRRR